MATKKPVLSVLVPCYNVEKYLPQCLDSIINQTLQDLEIIVINDGSKDSTLHIIKSYAERDKRIKVIDKENEGYGKSMNRGLDAATGKYIGIVESDDWIDTDMFENLVKIADDNKADVVKSNFYKYTTVNGVKNIKNNSIPYWDANRIIFPRSESSIFFSAPAIWSAIYNREFLIKNQIRFLESPGASFQDTGFNFKVLACAERVWLTTDAWLHYRCDNENSSVKSSGKIFCVCDEYDEIEHFLIDGGKMDDTLRSLIIRRKYDTYKWNANRLTDQAKQQFMVRFESEYADYHRQHVIPRRYFDDKTWFRVLSIAHPKNLIYPVLRTITSVISPIFRTKIVSGHKEYLLFNKIVIKKVKL